jgi:hypothetical protein
MGEGPGIVRFGERDSLLSKESGDILNGEVVERTTVPRRHNVLCSRLKAMLGCHTPVGVWPGKEAYSL